MGWRKARPAWRGWSHVRRGWTGRRTNEENGLVLVVGLPSGKLLYLAVAAWLLGEWDELPNG
jgi:hypothetical protein